MTARKTRDQPESRDERQRQAARRNGRASDGVERPDIGERQFRVELADRAAQWLDHRVAGQIRSNDEKHRLRVPHLRLREVQRRLGRECHGVSRTSPMTPATVRSAPQDLRRAPTAASARVQYFRAAASFSSTTGGASRPSAALSSLPARAASHRPRVIRSDEVIARLGSVPGRG